MILFGFELEGFYKDKEGLTIPPIGVPVDGFPGLVEIRTIGGTELRKSYFNLLEHASQYKDVDYTTPLHKFSTDELRELRKREANKRPVDVRNIYNKKPRDLKGATIASLQINISNRVGESYPIKDKEGNHVTTVPARYELLDIGKIVTALDIEFSKEIKESGRQQGEYAIKEGYRLEYRSLPNSVAPFVFSDINPFLDRVKKAVFS